MKPVKTANSNHNFGPPPGHEETVGDLPCQKVTDEGYLEIRSIWEPSQEERDYIAAGGNIELGIGWIGAFPPVSLSVTDECAIDDAPDPAPRCAAGTHYHGAGDVCECGQVPNAFMADDA